MAPFALSPGLEPFRLTLKQGGGYYPNVQRVINLPPPDWWGAGYEAVQSVAGLPERYVISDGTDYRDRNGNVISEPWWLPYGAALHVDFANSRFYWSGTTNTLGDLTAIGDGSYTLAFASVGATWTGDYTVQSETIIDLTTVVAENFAGWRNSGTSYQQMQVTGSGSSGVNRMWQLIASYPAPTVQYTVEARDADAQNDGLMTFEGINRSIWSIPSGAKGRSLWSGGAGFLGVNANGSIAAPVTLHFGRSPATGALDTTVTQRVYTIFTQALTATELRRANDLSLSRRPIWLLGDSALTHGQFLVVAKNAMDDIAVISWGQDGVGTTTLTQQAVRFASTPQAYDAMVIFAEMSNEVDGPASIAAINDAIGRLSHDYWMYMEPNPINPIGDSRRDDWEIVQAAILAEYGASRICLRLEVMMAAGDGSAGDKARIANGLYPETISADGTHLTNAGRLVDGAILVACIIDRGTVPGTTTVLGAPGNFTATPGNTEITLAWDTPDYTGTHPPEGYLVEQETSSGSGVWNALTAKVDNSTPNPTGFTKQYVREYVVTGLTNGVEYSFRVSAINAKGTGSTATAQATPAP